MAGQQWSGNQWDLVFTTAFGRPLNGTTVTRMFQRLLVRAGLPKKRSTISATAPRRSCWPKACLCAS